jgi:hypothetical protein
MSSPPDEFYCWVDFDSSRNFDVGVWKHFQVAVRFGVRRWMTSAKCKICGKLVGWSGCTGNLRKHLEIHHGDDIIPPVIRQDNILRGTIERICSQKPEEYVKQLTRLTQTIGKSNPDRQCGKFPVWCFYERREYVIRTVRCRLCNRNIFWNQKGLEKLKRHVNRVHVSASMRARMDEMYRFCVRLGTEQFIEIVSSP